MRLPKVQIIKGCNKQGQVLYILWKDIQFDWVKVEDDKDFYEAEGIFIGFHPRWAYKKLTIVADFPNEVFRLRLGEKEVFTLIRIDFARNNPI